MHIENLVKMANQIGSFFEAMPDHDEALGDIAGHVKKFWEPRMKRAFLAHMDSTGGEGVDPIVKEAIARHREKFEVTLREAA
ncbi:formate dehydrogenase subunit delta [Cupriavidus pauculus]|uniref:formate dehydrogenase subunit delta n=1 Tax=Cupriavidus pauculus TaxID=82633 RepID=UPI001EE29763|nr:formate dehydrogenase subunit delta [Cupriavidus pauculus]GJG93766.1 formate dehydrogenase [Cupriavidus pauculus]